MKGKDMGKHNAAGKISYQKNKEPNLHHLKKKLREDLKCLEDFIPFT